MNRKPLPTDADVKDLAKRLKALWASRQSVRPFLRQQAGLFRELQSKGWSWAGLALALNKAKLTYHTGKPWTADSLMQAFSRAQVPLQRQKLIAACRPTEFDKNPTNLINSMEVERSFNTPHPGVETPTASAAAAPASFVSDELVRAPPAPRSPVPQFKPFSLKPQELPSEVSSAEIEERAALHRRMFGS